MSDLKMLFRKALRERPQHYRKLLDIFIATWFMKNIGHSPIKIDKLLPFHLIPDFKDDKEFFTYISDLLKESFDVPKK